VSNRPRHLLEKTIRKMKKVVKEKKMSFELGPERGENVA